MSPAGGGYADFERRMRLRRAERLAGLAAEHLAAGRREAAREAVEEARALGARPERLAAIESVLAQPAPAGRSALLRVAIAAGVLALTSGVTASVRLERHPEAAAAKPSALASRTLMSAAPAVRAPATMPLVFDRPSPSSVSAPSRPDVTSPSRSDGPSILAAPVTVAPPRGPLVAGVTGQPPASLAPVMVPATALTIPVPPATTTGPAAAIAVAAPPPPTPVTTADEAPSIRRILARYADAYDRLDAGAAEDIWPGVNRSALTRAFDGLEKQQVTFSACHVDPTGDRASARCVGSTSWVPKVGDHRERHDAHVWAFELARAAGAWQIVSVSIQNK